MGKRERAREGMMYREGWLWFGELRTARQERLMGWRVQRWGDSRRLLL